MYVICDFKWDEHPMHFNVIAAELVINEMQCIIELQFTYSSYHIIAVPLSCLCKINHVFVCIAAQLHN